MSDSEPGGEQVYVRRKWKNEALDFTPWLAKNLDLLGETLSLKLEKVRLEEPVGPFSLDILAKKAGTESLVAIENQLEWTDHSHLGQLLTYAAGCKAKVAIWVATAFRYEHAEALHQLNEWIAGGIRFYGVKVELFEDQETGLQPRLCLVVSPGRWNKDVTEPPGATVSPEEVMYGQFFTPLVACLRQRGFSNQHPHRIFGYFDRSFPSPLNEGVWYMAYLGRVDFAWVTLHISTHDKDLTKRIFDSLKEDQQEIESAITTAPSAEWVWRRHDRFFFSEINIRREGSLADPPEKQEEIRAWMLDLLPQFKEVFDPRVKKILADIDSLSTDSG